MSTMLATRPDLPDPQSAPQLFEGLLTRRAIAYVVDVAILGVVIGLLAVAGLVFGILTLGLGLVVVPILLPFAVLVYYAATLGSPARATVGMQLMDIVLTPARGQPLDGWRILVHPFLFWLTAWICWPLSLGFALFTPRRQLVHDLICGTLMLRRSPMERHWEGLGAARA